MNLAEYMEHSPQRPPDPARVWRPPLESRATRPIEVRSKGSSRGEFTWRGRIYKAESAEEMDWGYALACHHRTRDLWDQPPAVEYVDPSGVLRRHTFDWLWTTSRLRVAFAVKPSSRVESSGIREVVERCARQSPTKFADKMAIVTERDLSPAQRHNARLLFVALRDRDQGDDDIVLDVIASLRGIVSISTIVRASGRNGCGFRAAARAIADRIIAPVAPGYITPDMMVRKVS